MGKVGKTSATILLILGLILLPFILSGCSGGGSATTVVEPSTESPVIETGDETAASPTGGAGQSGIVEVRMRPQAVVEPGFRTTSMVQPSQLNPGLPAPRTVSDAVGIVSVSATDYDRGLPHGNIHTSGDYAVFNANWVAGTAASIDDAAYCAYTIDLAGFTGDATVSIIWSENARPLIQSAYWVGIANYAENTWDFFEGPLDQVITLTSLAPYTSPTGKLVVIPVISWSSQIQVLEELKVGAAETRATGLNDGDVQYYVNEPDFYISDLPAAVDLTASCSPVGDQGRWGACASFGVGRGACDQEFNRIYGGYGWDPTDPAFQVSPKYAHVETGKYEQSTPTANAGRYLGQIAYLIREDGIASELNAPFDGIYDDDWSDAALEDAAVLRTADYRFIDVRADSGVDAMKYILAVQGKVLFMATNLDRYFGWYGADSVWNFTGPTWACHAMAIVGYDDALQAFRVRNSWGQAWGDGGYLWIGYETFRNEAASVRAGYMVADYSPAIVDRFLGSEPAYTPPVNFRASAGSSSDAITLTWDELRETDYFLISRDTPDNVVAQVYGHKWSDITVTDELCHTYWVRAVYPDGESRLSSPMTGYLKLTAAEIRGITPLSCPARQMITFIPSIRGTGVTSFAWDFGDAATPRYSSAATPSVMTAAPGRYSISLVITDEFGTDEFTAQLTLSNGKPPCAVISYEPALVFHDTDIIFNALDSYDEDGWIVLYEWDWENDGSFDEVSDEHRAHHCFGSGGTFEVLLRVTDCEGLVNTTVMELEVLGEANPPIVDFTHSGGYSDYQPPASVQFDASGTYDYEYDICLYEWDLDGDGEFDRSGRYLFDPLWTYPDHAEIPVTLKVTDEQGLSTSLTKSLRIGLGRPVPGWDVHGIASTGLASGYNVLDVEINNGAPAMLWNDTAGQLHLAETGRPPDCREDWTITELLGDSLTADAMTGLAYDSAGRPVVSFYSSTPEPGVRFGIRFTGSGWEFSDVFLSGDGYAGAANAIEVVNGRPVILYEHNSSNNNLNDIFYYARATTSAPASIDDWDTTQILKESTRAGGFATATPGGRPALFYGKKWASYYKLYYSGAATLTPGGRDSWATYPLSGDSFNNCHWALTEIDGHPLAGIMHGREDSSVQLLRAGVAQPASAGDWTWTTVGDLAGMPVDFDLTIIGGKPWIIATTGYGSQRLTIYEARTGEPASAADWTRYDVLDGGFMNCRILEVDGAPAVITYCAENNWLYYMTPE